MRHWKITKSKEKTEFFTWEYVEIDTGQTYNFRGWTYSRPLFTFLGSVFYGSSTMCFVSHCSRLSFFVVGLSVGQNHEFIHTKPWLYGHAPPQEAEKRGLAPRDLFPHKSNAKIPVLNNEVSHQMQTSTPKITKIATMNLWSPSFYCHALGNGRHSKTSIGTLRGNIYNVCVRWLLPSVLCIGGTTITFGYNRVQQFVDSSCLRLANKH
jgi:hypothetical protein